MGCDKHTPGPSSSRSKGEIMQPISHNELKRRLLQCGGVSPDDMENAAIMGLFDRAESAEARLQAAEEALREIQTVARTPEEAYTPNKAFGLIERLVDEALAGPEPNKVRIA